MPYKILASKAQQRWLKENYPDYSHYTFLYLPSIKIIPSLRDEWSRLKEMSSPLLCLTLDALITKLNMIEKQPLRYKKSNKKKHDRPKENEVAFRCTKPRVALFRDKLKWGAKEGLRWSNMTASGCYLYIAEEEMDQFVIRLQLLHRDSTFRGDGQVAGNLLRTIQGHKRMDKITGTAGRNVEYERIEPSDMRGLHYLAEKCGARLKSGWEMQDISRAIFQRGEDDYILMSEEIACLRRAIPEARDFCDRLDRCLIRKKLMPIEDRGNETYNTDGEIHRPEWEESYLEEEIDDDSVVGTVTITPIPATISLFGKSRLYDYGVDEWDGDSVVFTNAEGREMFVEALVTVMEQFMDDSRVEEQLADEIMGELDALSEAGN